MTLLPLAAAAGGGSIDGLSAPQLVAAGFTLLQRSAPLVRALAGRRSALLLPSGPQFLTALAASDGRGAVLINPLAAPAEIAFQLADANVGAVFTVAPLAKRLAPSVTHVLLDEARHMRMYHARIMGLGHHVGDLEVRDWFWSRVPTCADPLSFVAVMGLGLESANLEHAATFAAAFRDAGDEESARVQEVVGLEEIAHVRFGARWFTHFRGAVTFDAWCAALPSPLTPLLMRGTPLRRDARLRAGQPEAFLDELEAWTPSGS